MTNTAQVEIFIVVDEDGDFEVANDQELAFERYNDEINGDYATQCFKLNLTIPLPKIIEASAEISDSETTATITTE